MLFLSCISVCQCGIDYCNFNPNLQTFFFGLMCTFGFLQIVSLDSHLLDTLTIMAGHSSNKV